MHILKFVYTIQCTACHEHKLIPTYYNLGHIFCMKCDKFVYIESLENIRLWANSEATGKVAAFNDWEPPLNDIIHLVRRLLNIYLLCAIFLGRYCFCDNLILINGNKFLRFILIISLCCLLSYYFSIHCPHMLLSNISGTK